MVVVIVVVVVVVFVVIVATVTAVLVLIQLSILLCVKSMQVYFSSSCLLILVNLVIEVVIFVV